MTFGKMASSILLQPQLLLPCLLPSAAQYALYNFAEEGEVAHGFGSLSSYLRWDHADGNGDNLLATTFHTACGFGQFGGKIMGDGSHNLIFSITDAHQAAGSANAVEPTCSRFDRSNSLLWPPANVEGVSCIVSYRFEFGTEYRFALNQTNDETGTMWSLSVTKGSAAAATHVGFIFMDRALSTTACSTLEPQAESFLHCPHTASSVSSSAGSWRGPFVNGKETMAPANVDTDCGLDSAQAFVPARVAAENGKGVVGRPNIFFERGVGIRNDCEKASLWTSAVASTETSGLGSSINWMGPTPIICTAGVAFVLAIASMLVSYCRRPAQFSRVNKAAPAVTDDKLAPLTEEAETDAESGEGSGGNEEHLSWEGLGEGNNFVRVPGSSSNAR